MWTKVGDAVLLFITAPPIANYKFTNRLGEVKLIV